MEMSVEETKVMVISRQPSLVQSMVDQKQPDSVDCITNVDMLITCFARCAHKIKCSIAIAQAIFSKRKTSHKQTELKKKK
jgi:hypothetical protein